LLIFTNYKNVKLISIFHLSVFIGLSHVSIVFFKDCVFFVVDQNVVSNVHDSGLTVADILAVLSAAIFEHNDCIDREPGHGVVFGAGVSTFSAEVECILEVHVWFVPEFHDGVCVHGARTQGHVGAACPLAVGHALLEHGALNGVDASDDLLTAYVPALVGEVVLEHVDQRDGSAHGLVLPEFEFLQQAGVLLGHVVQVGCGPCAGRPDVVCEFVQFVGVFVGDNGAGGRLRVCGHDHEFRSSDPHNGGSSR